MSFCRFHRRTNLVQYLSYTRDTSTMWWGSCVVAALNLRIMATHPVTYPCQHPHCRTCSHISSETDLLGPKDRLTIKDSFSCLSSGLIYCISCRCCPAIYIGETGLTLRERFGEHLRSINKIAHGLHVAEHFSSNRHTAADALVRGIKLCEGNKQRKR